VLYVQAGQGLCTVFTAWVFGCAIIFAQAQLLHICYRDSISTYVPSCSLRQYGFYGLLVLCSHAQAPGSFAVLQQTREADKYVASVTLSCSWHACHGHVSCGHGNHNM